MPGVAGARRRTTTELVMKRTRGHLIFAVVTAAFATAAVGEWLRLPHAAAVLTDPRAPEAHLVHAVALAKTDYDGALGAYKAIIQGNREDLRRIALYDLGNLHLRQALRAGLSDESQSLPL